jgi:hypothetical protein
MYHLAIVPKVKKSIEYSTAYGSQHDYKHIAYCMDFSSFNIDIQYQIIYEESFLKVYDKFDGALFIGLSWKMIDFITHEKNIDIYIWAFTQCVWNQTPEVFNNTSIVFEQSTLDMSQFSSSFTDLYSLPLGFQSNRFKPKSYTPKYDIVFNGTLFRDRREGSKNHRVDLLELLLKNNISIINYNGRSRNSDEKALLLRLKPYKNFKVKDIFGESEHYHHGRYSLDLPFLDTGVDPENDKKFGISWYELENSIWLNHWDIFRAIGSKCNIITFDSPYIRSLGLSDENVHFYRSNPENLKEMADEISIIVSKKKVKMINNDVWNSNSFIERWEFIVNKIRLKKSIPYRNDSVTLTKLI